MTLHRTGLKMCLLAATIFVGRGHATDARVLPTAAPAVVAHTYYPEVRLRKVHLVRPDLIFYPLDYEIFC